MINCKICGLPFYSINSSHLRTHGMDVHEYRRQFPDAETITEETKNLIREANEGKVHSIETRIKMANSHFGVPFSDEHREHISEALTGMKRKPHTFETRQRISKTAKKVIHTQEWNDNVSRACSDFWNSTRGKELREKLVSERVTDEYRETLSKVRTEMWKTSEYREAQAKSFNYHSNISELWLSKILEESMPGLWTFVGSGDKLVGEKYPDFIHKGKPLIIELFGSYWHLESEIDPLKSYYKGLGFGSFIVWDYELCDTDLVEKLRAFEEAGLEDPIEYQS